MYELFTDRARKVMQLANQEAKRFNHEYIDTEHILLGLVKEGTGVASYVLKKLDIDLQQIRHMVEAILVRDPNMVSFDRLPMTARAKKVIEYAMEEARSLKHTVVGSEHILLALLREQDGAAAQVLGKLGLELEGARKEVVGLLRAAEMGGSSKSPGIALGTGIISMYERFTDRARKVMQLANQEAKRFNHEYIGTEHLLLGLISEGTGVACKLLRHLDIDLHQIRLEVESVVQGGPTPRAKKIIEYAMEEARNLKHTFVGTEHILLALLREQEGAAAQVLGQLGLNLGGARKEVVEIDRDGFDGRLAWLGEK